jgi:hypothetical protein
MEIERPRVAKEELDEPQPLRRNSSDLRSRFALFRAIEFATYQGSQELRVESGGVAAQVIMGCGRMVLAEEFFEETMSEEARTNVLLSHRRALRKGYIRV